MNERQRMAVKEALNSWKNLLSLLLLPLHDVIQEWKLIQGMSSDQWHDIL